MTESDWLTTPYRAHDMLRQVRAKASPRKLQLLGCGCARLVSAVLTPRQMEMLNVIELHADGRGHPSDYELVVAECERAYQAIYGWALRGEPPPAPAAACVTRLFRSLVSTPAADGLERAMQWVFQAARESADYSQSLDVARQMQQKVCDLFREVIGNPFAKRVVVGPGWEQSGGVVAGWMTRVGETARLIATGVQAEQAFDRLPILADALEDDGCTDAELLAHLRGPGPHVRGCWAVDVVLGKG